MLVKLFGMLTLVNHPRHGQTFTQKTYSQPLLACSHEISASGTGEFPVIYFTLSSPWAFSKFAPPPRLMAYFSWAYIPSSMFLPFRGTRKNPIRFSFGRETGENTLMNRVTSVCGTNVLAKQLTQDMPMWRGLAIVNPP
jgi:hypothetical protein